jgi:competence ComEA-like helix-hairpin-helix protein
MSNDTFKDYMAQREAKLRSPSPIASSSPWLWLLLAAILLATIVILFLRANPSTGPINPNTADLTLLMTLPGIGPEIANKIVKQRKAKPFTQADDLLAVPGIGPKTLDKMRQRLKFQP